jgi:hypothetical protein
MVVSLDRISPLSLHKCFRFFLWISSRKPMYRMRIHAVFLAASAVLPLLAACGDTIGPTDDGPLNLWVRDTGVVLEPGETMTLSARVQVPDG